MEYAVIQELNTPRLKLRKLTTEDAPLYYTRLGSSFAVSKYMLWNPHTDSSETELLIHSVLQRYETGKCYRWAIALCEDDSIIGVIELLRFDEEANSCSFAYMLGEAYWGKGYGTEALAAAIDFGFSRLKLDAIIADHMAENSASGSVMQKAGMHFLQTIPHKYEKNGKVQDAVEYCITRKDWLLQKECNGE